MSALGLDIGGANIKAAHSAGGAWSLPFALWKRPDDLTAQLRQLAAQAPPFEHLLVTMTAELCDCFATKRQGVNHVLDSVEALAARRPARVWLTEGRFASVSEAREKPLACAAANWHALATHVAQLHPQGTTLLIDTGSTTTDLLLLRDGRVQSRGLTDTDRLASGELLYLGARRTPLAALGPHVRLDGRRLAVMAELFATTADVFLLSGDLPEQPDSTDSADGRPLTRAHAAARVLRMVGADLEMLDIAAAQRLARAFTSIAQRRIRAAARQVVEVENVDRVVVSGSGAFLATRAMRTMMQGAPLLHLAEPIGAEASVAAAAYALVRLHQHDETR